jgi:hypothetical protein
LREKLEDDAQTYAIQNIVPRHFEEVTRNREDLIVKTMAAVKDRLTKEIAYWDHRAAELKVQEEAGKQPRMNWQKARERADGLQARLQRRMEELDQERAISPLPPLVIGAVLIVPKGLLARLGVIPGVEPDLFARETKEVEAKAMRAVMDAERSLAYQPRDVSRQNLGYDIESRDAVAQRLRFIEVKGRVKGATTVTVTRNEILTALNKPDDFILAVVEVEGDRATPRYLRKPFQREPDFAVTSVNYDLSELVKAGHEPRETGGG